MGYGVVSEIANQRLVTVRFHPDYGEIRTVSVDTGSLPGEDVSIHTAISSWGITRPENHDAVAVGVSNFVEGGTPTDFGADAWNWRAFVFSTTLSFFRVSYLLAANGGYLRGSQFVQFWGDTAARDAREDLVTSESARVVYDPATGVIRHVHHRIDLNGPARDDDPDGDPVSVARSLGHQGDLEVLDVETGDLTDDAQLVDVEAKRLVPDDRPAAE
jgi:hypothetical protein